MRSYDFTPLTRSAVGFDRLFSLLESASRAEPAGWPPYNIETLGENRYRIEIAVAGFRPDELNVEAKENVLIVAGRKTANDQGSDERQFLHRGLAERDFERRFQLENGLLAIELERQLPEALKPRRIPIATGAGEAIEGKAETKKLKSA